MTLGIGKVWAFNSPGPTKEIRNELINKIPGISKPPCRGLVQVRSAYDVIAKWQYAEGKIIDVTTVAGNHSLASLQKGIEAAVNGHPLVPPPPAKRTIASTFNDLSKHLAVSKTVGTLIDKLHGGRGGHKPPDCGCC